MEQKFDQHSALEADIKKLAEIVEQQKHRESREVIREELRGKIFEGERAPQPEMPAAPPPETTSMLPAYAAEELPAETKLKVEELIDVAWHKGTDEAVAEAWKLAKARGAKDGPALLDAFHDALTGKVHDLMKEKGLL